MPVLLRFGRFKVVVYPKDHQPPHVHVLGAGAEVKLNIETGEVIAVYGFNERAVRRFQEIVSENKDLLLAAWQEYQDEEA